MNLTLEGMNSLDTCFPGGHAVVRFENLRVPADDILGEAGKGFKYAQVRLSPARLTHCMRWLGAVRRTHDIAVDYARRREAFGKRIFADLRAFRIYDGPSEVHRWSIAKRILKG